MCEPEESFVRIQRTKCLISGVYYRSNLNLVVTGYMIDFFCTSFFTGFMRVRGIRSNLVNIMNFFSAWLYHVKMSTIGLSVGGNIVIIITQSFVYSCFICIRFGIQ